MPGIKVTNERPARPIPASESVAPDIDDEDYDWEPDVTTGIPPGTDPGDVLTWDGDSWEPAASAVDAHVADTTDAHDASAISIADAGGYYTGTDVEAALQEVGADLAEMGSGPPVPPPILLASDHATPFTFDDILQNSEGTDFLWASE